jgi:type II restriction enzyme
MNLSMTGSLAAAYHSGAQRARVVTEAWGEKNLFCPNCSSPKLTWLEPGHPASDYSCPACGFWYQLKSQKSRISDSITDGAYRAMMQALHNDELPSFYFMQYDLATWRVRNLLLVPHFAFPPSAIIKRKPLAATARRAGWVGCNFDLSRIPAEARIPVVNETLISPTTEVREKFKRVIPLKEIPIQQRGWTLDVLNAVRRLGKAQFTTADAYTFAPELEKLHPENRHVRDKIRQQLQILRDADLLIHVDRGIWRLP